MAAQKGGEEESLRGLLKGLRLSEAETKGIRGAWSVVAKGSNGEEQVVGKLFAEKSGFVDGIVQTLGPIWCPRKGIKCRDLGDNLFMITFLQPGGKRRALEDGPWEHGGNLFVVREFDGRCRLEELEFVTTPCWVRVLQLPLGMMNRATGEMIGNVIGNTIEVDAEENGNAMGRYLRVKVLLDIRKPLLRGVTMEVEEGGESIWCPLRYEYLPNFCYACGRLGHVERVCDSSSWREKKKQFESELCVMPSKRRYFEEGKQRSFEAGGSGGARSDRSRGCGGSGGRFSWRETKKSGADSAKWGEEIEEGLEVTSPMKTCAADKAGGVPKKLLFEDQAQHKVDTGKKMQIKDSNEKSLKDCPGGQAGAKVAGVMGGIKQAGELSKGKEEDKDSAMQGIVFAGVPMGTGARKEEEDKQLEVGVCPSGHLMPTEAMQLAAPMHVEVPEMEKKTKAGNEALIATKTEQKKTKPRTYKKRNPRERTNVKPSDGGLLDASGQKRPFVEHDLDADMSQKKRKAAGDGEDGADGVLLNVMAGLHGQSRPAK